MCKCAFVPIISHSINVGNHWSRGKHWLGKWSDYHVSLHPVFLHCFSTNSVNSSYLQSSSGCHYRLRQHLYFFCPSCGCLLFLHKTEKQLKSSEQEWWPFPISTSSSTLHEQLSLKLFSMQIYWKWGLSQCTFNCLL